MQKAIQKRIGWFLILWIIIYLLFVNFYSANLPLNADELSFGNLQEKAYQLSKSQQDEIAHKVVSFFDSKIGSGKLNYDTSAYNGFQLYLNIEDTDEITYIESLMTFVLDEVSREVSYGTTAKVGNSLQKDEIFSLITNIRIVTPRDIAVTVGPSKKIEFGIVGHAWIYQEPDRNSKIILLILSFLLLSWFIGTIQILNIFFRKGLELN